MQIDIIDTDPYHINKYLEMDYVLGINPNLLEFLDKLDQTIVRH